MDVTIRLGIPDDANRCGTIFYEAFKAIAEYHRFPRDSSGPERGIANFARKLSHPGYHVIVAELDGHIVGSNALDERSTIVGLGPITIDPAVQNRSIGRELMQAARQRVAERQASGVRLVQAAYHNRSLSLYTRLGFEVREPLVTLQGPRLAVQVPGHTVRQANEGDLDGCNALCVGVSTAMTGVVNSWRLCSAGRRPWLSMGTSSPAMRPCSGTMVMPWGRATQRCRR